MIKSSSAREGKAVTESEVNRAVQYVTASTSYGRETVEEIIKTGF